jgi:hypothetical protein
VHRFELFGHLRMIRLLNKQSVTSSHLKLQVAGMVLLSLTPGQFYTIRIALFALADGKLWMGVRSKGSQSSRQLTLRQLQHQDHECLHHSPIQSISGHPASMHVIIRNASFSLTTYTACTRERTPKVAPGF